MTPLMSTLPFPFMGAMGTLVLVGVAPHVLDSTDLVEVLLDEGIVRHEVQQVLLGVGCGVGLILGLPAVEAGGDCCSDPASNQVSTKLPW